MTHRDVIADFSADGAEFGGLVTRLDGAGWRTPTPAPRWTVADQVAHLALDQPAQAVAEPTPYTGRRQYSAAS